MFVSSSVPVSSWKPPPTILTKPVAVDTSVSALLEVNVNVSPSSYNVPASSTTTSLTEPPLIPSTTIVAFSFPIACIVTVSWSVWRIPSLVRTVDVKKGWTVNLTVKSLVVEIALTISASENVPSIGTISNMVTESLYKSLFCCVVRALTTVAVALDVPPVITWLTISSPVLPPIGVTLNVVFWPHSPADGFII